MSKTNDRPLCRIFGRSLRLLVMTMSVALIPLPQVVHRGRHVETVLRSGSRVGREWSGARFCSE